jgi:predicted RNA-binding protein YlqC (UPF0109 family)
MKELIQFLARQLVNNPDAVEVKETRGDSVSVLELWVAKEDLGRVIGKQGRIVKSIRAILHAVLSQLAEVCDEHAELIKREQPSGPKVRDLRGSS